MDWKRGEVASFCQSLLLKTPPRVKFLLGLGGWGSVLLACTGLVRSGHPSKFERAAPTSADPKEALPSGSVRECFENGAAVCCEISCARANIVFRNRNCASNAVCDTVRNQKIVPGNGAVAKRRSTSPSN